jgi:RHS repeat-associated protein
VRLLAVITPSGGGEYVEFYHPDRLGTRLIANSSNEYVGARSTLPYGTVISAETSAVTGRRFTSYERSGATGLDYAVNRHYDPSQGRLTQADPVGMSAVSLDNPQTLNLCR